MKDEPVRMEPSIRRVSLVVFGAGLTILTALFTYNFMDEMRIERHAGSFPTVGLISFWMSWLMLLIFAVVMLLSLRFKWVWRVSSVVLFAIFAIMLILEFKQLDLFSADRIAFVIQVVSFVAIAAAGVVYYVLCIKHHCLRAPKSAAAKEDTQTQVGTPRPLKKRGDSR